MKQENKTEQESKKPVRGKKYGTYLAVGVGALALSVSMLVSSITAKNKESAKQVNNTGEQSEEIPTAETEEFFSPVASLTVLNDYGFYFNKTLNAYYAHDGVDFSAAEGENVYAANDGTVESVFTSDLLVGAKIVLDHGNGVKTVYEYVDPVETLKAGDKVSRGQAIATVAAATGDEYKDGAHLHFSVMEKNETADPAKYLDFGDK